MRRYELLCEALKRINGNISLQVYASNDEDDRWLLAYFKCENWDCFKNSADLEKFRLAMENACYDEIPGGGYFANPENWKNFLRCKVILAHQHDETNWSVSIVRSIDCYDYF